MLWFGCLILLYWWFHLPLRLPLTRPLESRMFGMELYIFTLLLVTATMKAFILNMYLTRCSKVLLSKHKHV